MVKWLEVPIGRVTVKKARAAVRSGLLLLAEICMSQPDGVSDKHMNNSRVMD